MRKIMKQKGEKSESSLLSSKHWFDEIAANQLTNRQKYWNSFPRPQSATEGRKSLFLSGPIIIRDYQKYST